MKLTVNGKAVEVAGVEDDARLLWVLREDLGLTGAKYGCGVGLCGACTVIVDGEAVRSCVSTAGDAVGKSIATIEGLTEAGSAVQAAWLEEDVSQCGYCQPGMIMAATALLRAHPKPTDAQIDEAMTNICRCGTYPQIRAAIHRAAGMRTPAR
jgi:isoquinoline 1-oxidoreductase alpha subunit